MIYGVVNYNLEPVVNVEIEDDQGRLQSYEVVIDTAFSGELALPDYVIDRLGLSYKGPSSAPWTMATGQREFIAEFTGTVHRHGERRMITVLETYGESLLGTALLSGSLLYVDFRRNGDVLIEEDWPT